VTLPTASASQGEALRQVQLRLLLFLYSNTNIAGCTLALLGPALLFLNVIGPWWWLITAGLYAMGWLLGAMLWGSDAPDLERRIEASLSLEQTLSQLDALRERVAPALTPAMNLHLSNIRNAVSEILPRMIEAKTHDADLFTLRETVLRYLPETLANYVALPPLFRVSHPLQDGKVARDLLADQLALLDTKVREIVGNVSSADAQALLVNGQFLEMKFRQPDFLVR